MSDDIGYPKTPGLSDATARVNRAIEASKNQKPKTGTVHSEADYQNLLQAFKERVLIYDGQDIECLHCHTIWPQGSVSQHNPSCPLSE